MSIFLEAQQQVAAKMIEQHDDIIREFLSRIEVEPPCECGWLDRRVNFAEFLAKYIRLKLLIHRAHKAGLQIHSTVFHEIGYTRSAIAKLAPCPICIVAFNPTHRRQLKPWNPKRARVWKELLN
jgi:hypothetical protein